MREAESSHIKLASLLFETDCTHTEGGVGGKSSCPVESEGREEKKGGREGKVEKGRRRREGEIIAVGVWCYHTYLPEGVELHFR